MDASSSSPNKILNSLPGVIEDCFGILKLYSDGSIFRVDSSETKCHINTHDDGSAVWKECIFDPEHNLKLRIYKPKNHHRLSPTDTDTNTCAFDAGNPDHNNYKLPVVYYLHAGGFCFPSSNAHNTCLSLCSGLQAIVISPYYRLAPEHRLPAAMEDAHKALKYLQNQALLSSEAETGIYCESWVCGDGVDLDRVFIFGDSAGGNIAHHLAVQLGQGSPELRPIRIRGYILLSPFFGGVERTKSEEERPNEDFWSQEIYDQFWRLAIPKGGNRDHPWVNPFGPESPSLEGINLGPILVLVGGDEILKDRAEEYAKRMKLWKNSSSSSSTVMYVEFEGKRHGFFTCCSYLEESKNVIKLVRKFMSEL